MHPVSIVYIYMPYITIYSVREYDLRNDIFTLNKYATVKRNSALVWSQATKHHVFRVSFVSWSLEVNSLGNSSKECSEAGQPEQNAHY